MTFNEFIARETGATRWCVANRTAPRLVADYGTVFTHRRFAALEVAYELEHRKEALRLATDYERRFGAPLLHALQLAP